MSIKRQIVLIYYAAGDIAQTYDPALEETTVNALWPNAVEQGCIAGPIS